MTPGADTSLAAAQANILATSTDRVAFLNAQLKAQYTQAVENWNVNASSGQQNLQGKPPVAPHAYELAPPDSDGFVWPQISATTLITSDVEVVMPNVAPVPVPNTIVVGNAIGGGWFSAGQGDTFPSGSTTPPMTTSQGVNGTFEKFGAPVGNGWYLKVG